MVLVRRDHWRAWTWLEVDLWHQNWGYFQTLTCREKCKQTADPNVKRGQELYLDVASGSRDLASWRLFRHFRVSCIDFWGADPAIAGYAGSMNLFNWLRFCCSCCCCCCWCNNKDWRHSCWNAFSLSTSSTESAVVADESADFSWCWSDGKFGNMVLSWSVSLVGWLFLLEDIPTM